MWFLLMRALIMGRECGKAEEIRWLSIRRDRRRLVCPGYSVHVKCGDESVPRPSY